MLPRRSLKAMAVGSLAASLLLLFSAARVSASSSSSPGTIGAPWRSRDQEGNALALDRGILSDRDAPQERQQQQQWIAHQREGVASAKEALFEQDQELPRTAPLAEGVGREAVQAEQEERVEAVGAAALEGRKPFDYSYVERDGALEDEQEQEEGGVEDEVRRNGGDGSGVAAAIAGVAASVAAALAAAVGSALSSAAPETLAELSRSVMFPSDGLQEGGKEESLTIFRAPASDAGSQLEQEPEAAEAVAPVGVAKGKRLRGASPPGGSSTVRIQGGTREGEGEGVRGDVAGVAGREAGASSFEDSGVHRALQAETPSPVPAVEVPETAAPVSAPDLPITDQPLTLTEIPVEPATLSPVTPLLTPAPIGEEVLTPAPSVEEETSSPVEVDETLEPSVTPSPDLLDETPAPSAETLAPGASPAPTLGGTLTPAPTMDGTSGATLMGSLSPTPAPGATESPSNFNSTSAPGNDTLTPAPSVTVTETSVTASPTDAVTEVEEALDTTGDVVSNTATVAVATTAAAATVTATTAATTTAATSATTSTISTVASAAASGGSAGGTSSTATTAGATTVGTTTGSTGVTTATTATGGTTSTTGTLTTTTVAPDGTTTVNSTASTTTATDPGSISSRSPSATLGLLMIFQMQFVSLLRLMEANITDPFMNFLDSLKWMNLHFEVDVSFFSCDNEETTFAWANDDNGTWALNTFLVLFLLAIIILVHIVLVSYLEASWLSQANAIHRHRLEFIRSGRSQEAAAPFDGRTQAAYEKYLDAKNQDRDLYEQEKASAERYLKRHNAGWMYFPHVELLFLLLAYQGASAAESRMIYSGCFPLVVLGICSLVVFPLLMLIYVSRIVWSRVRPSNSPLVFEPNPEFKKGCFLVKACAGMCYAWTHGTSMFSWADKGQWISKNDEEVDFDSRKFRIGFEPLFVDYTKSGSIYVTFLLFEWFSFGLISGLVTNGTIQTGAVFLIYVLDFLILVCLRPFSNSIIQCFTTMTVFADALTVGLMCYASILDPDDDDDSESLEVLYAAVLSIQTLAILFFVVPLYVDAFITLLGALCKTCTRCCKKSKTTKPKAPIKGSPGETASIFCALVNENFIGCVRSTLKGPSYNPSNVALERRRSSLLLPIQEESSSDEETPNPAFGKLPTGPVISSKVPSARHPRVMSASNALQDYSDSSRRASSNTLQEYSDSSRRGSRSSSSGGSSSGGSGSSRSLRDDAPTRGGNTRGGSSRSLRNDAPTRGGNARGGSSRSLRDGAPTRGGNARGGSSRSLRNDAPPRSGNAGGGSSRSQRNDAPPRSVNAGGGSSRSLRNDAPPRSVNAGGGSSRSQRNDAPTRGGNAGGGSSRSLRNDAPPRSGNARGGSSRSLRDDDPSGQRRGSSRERSRRNVGGSVPIGEPSSPSGYSRAPSVVRGSRR